MSKVCCQFYPACYCLEVLRNPAHDQRMRLLRDAVPPGDPLRIELLTRVRTRRRRNVLVCLVTFTAVVFAALVMLTGCDPRDGVEPSPTPQPSGTEMFTVINPDDRMGGIYDNN